MQDIQSLFADYASYHQTSGNKAFHRLGIPMIMLTLIGMLAQVKLFESGGVRIDEARFDQSQQNGIATAARAISSARLISWCIRWLSPIAVTSRWASSLRHHAMSSNRRWTSVHTA